MNIDNIPATLTRTTRTMRAKLKLISVFSAESHDHLTFNAVCKPTSYPEDGLDEDNTYAKFSPSAELKITVNNPALIGKFRPGQKFYVDFTEATS